MYEDSYEKHAIWEKNLELLEKVNRFSTGHFVPEEVNDVEELHESAHMRLEAAKEVATYISQLKYKANPKLISTKSIDALENAIHLCLVNWENKELASYAEHLDDYDYERRMIEQYDKNITSILEFVPLLNPWALAVADKAASFEMLNKSYGKMVEETQDEIRESLKFKVTETSNTVQLLEDRAHKRVLALETYLDTTAAETIQTHTNEIQEKRKEFIASIEEMLKSLNYISNGAEGELTGSEYKEHAKSERKAGTNATIIGVFILLAGLVALFFIGGNVFDSSIFNQNFWQILSLKFSSTLILSAIGTVCIRFGSRSLHRGNEYKRQHLELVSLFALMKTESTMSEEDKKLAYEARINFFNKSYGRAWENTGVNEAKEDLGSGELVKILAEALADRRLRE